jgi:hypothetical protein
LYHLDRAAVEKGALRDHVQRSARVSHRTPIALVVGQAPQRRFEIGRRFARRVGEKNLQMFPNVSP